jgi:hypothetical protein
MQEASDGAGNPRNQLDMQYTMGDVIIGNETENLSFINISGVGSGEEDAVGIEGKMLAIPRELFCLSAQTGCAEGCRW